MYVFSTQPNVSLEFIMINLGSLANDHSIVGASFVCLYQQ